MVRRDLEQLRGARFEQCFAKAFDSHTDTFTLSGVQTTISNATDAASNLASWVGGNANDSSAIHATMILVLPAARIPMYLDNYIVRVGRDEVQLNVVAGAPYSRATEERLLMLLLKRARATSH